MGKKQDPTRVLVPLSFRDLAGMAREYPSALFVAGGTDLMRKIAENTLQAIPETVISLSRIDELQRIRRKEQGIEIGACVPISRVLSIGQNVVPRLLLDALGRVANPAVRNTATLGGNICLASPFSDVIVPLALLDARLEIRGLAGHSWIPLTRFARTPWTNSLLPSEILSSVSIPILQAEAQMYRKLDVISTPTLSVLTFAGMARIYRSTVTDFRVVYGGVDPLFMRNREIESSVTGRKIPFTGKFIDQFMQKTREYIEGCDPGFLPDRYHRNSAIRLTRQLMEQISRWRPA